MIIDGELVPDIGGGVCQVSTTLYAAALALGTARSTSRVPHSIPAAYVPLGFDATVVYDTSTFAFKTIRTITSSSKSTVEGDRLTVAFYGDRPRFESARLESEVVEVLPRKVIRESRQGLTRGRGTRHPARTGRLPRPRVAGGTGRRRKRGAGSGLALFLPGSGCLGWVGS